VPALFGIFGGVHTIGSTHSRPFCTKPAGQTHVVPEAFGTSGERHSIVRTHSRPFCTVPGGHTHTPGIGPEIIGG
jgi:hypothetical protein